MHWVCLARDCGRFAESGFLARSSARQCVLHKPARLQNRSGSGAAFVGESRHPVQLGARTALPANLVRFNYATSCFAVPQTIFFCQTKLISFVQDDNGVTAQLADASGCRETVTADYVAGCDSDRSTVRELFDIKVRGNRYLYCLISTYIRSAKLGRVYGLCAAYRYMFAGPNGLWAVPISTCGGSTRTTRCGVPLAGRSPVQSRIAAAGSAT